MLSLWIARKVALESVCITTAPFPLLRECSRALEMVTNSAWSVKQVSDNLDDPVKNDENTALLLQGCFYLMSHQYGTSCRTFLTASSAPSFCCCSVQFALLAGSGT